MSQIAALQDQAEAERIAATQAVAAAEVAVESQVGSAAERRLAELQRKQMKLMDDPRAYYELCQQIAPVAAEVQNERRVAALTGKVSA